MRSQSTKIRRKHRQDDKSSKDFVENILVRDKAEIFNNEFSILMEEYKVLKSEISQLLHEARQITNLAVTAMGIFLGGVAAIFQLQIKIIPEILLVMPFFFYFLTCIQLRYVYQALDIGKYLRNTTIPHIQDMVTSNLPEMKKETESVLSWEMPKRGRFHNRGILFFPIAGASYGMPFLFSILLIGMYKFLNPGLQPYLNIENILLMLNFLAIVYCAIWALNAERER